MQPLGHPVVKVGMHGNVSKFSRKHKILTRLEDHREKEVYTRYNNKNVIITLRTHQVNEFSVK